MARRVYSTQAYTIRRARRRSNGALPQQTIYLPRFTAVQNPRVDIPLRYGTPTVLWVGGDGITPTVGPTLTKVGAPAAVDGPHVLADGTRLQEEVFDGSADCYTCGTSIDPAAGEDFVIFLSFRTQREAVGATRFLFSTRTTGIGLQVYMFTATPNRLYTYVKGDAVAVDNAGDVTYGTRNVYVAVGDRDGNVRHWLNGTEGTPFAMPAGAIGTGLGFALAARADGASKLDCGIETFAYWKGAAGLAELWTAVSAARVFDIMFRSTVGDYARGAGGHTRAASASWLDTEGRWHLAAPGYCRSGDPGGIRSESTVTNLCARNKNPPNSADITVTGAMAKSVVNDSVALAAEKASAWGPAVYHLVNATGVDQYCTASVATGAVTAHSVQCIARIEAGSGVRIGLYDGATWTDGAALHDGYNLRTMAPNMTPANVNQKWALLVPTGVTMDFIAHQLEAGERCTMPRPNHATGGATSVGAPDVLDTGFDPVDRGGSVAMTIIPLGWSGQPAAANSVNCCGAVDLCTIRGATGRFRFWDQTNIAESPSAAVKPWSDGVAVDARHSWGGPGIYVNADGEADADAYDGTLPAGTLTLGRTAGTYAFACPRLMIQRNYQGGQCP